jgi:hypothetical protein
MSTVGVIALALAVVFGVLYVIRRRGRLSREDQD